MLFKPFRLAALDWAIQDIQVKKIRGDVNAGQPELGALKAEESGEQVFRGTITSVDVSAARFVLHETTQDRVRMLECSYTAAIKSKVIEYQNMKVFVCGVVERSILRKTVRGEGKAPPTGDGTGKRWRDASHQCREQVTRWSFTMPVACMKA